jgi:hypothetical protein
MNHPSHSSRFYHLKILGEDYKSLSSSLYSFLHTLVTSSLLIPNILLNTLFSNTLSLRSSLSLSNQVSHPYKHRQTYISAFLHLQMDGWQSVRRKILHRMIASIAWLHSAPNSWIKVWFVMVFPKYLNSSTLSKLLLSVFVLWLLPVLWSREMTMYYVKPIH